jgi:hypothetical protein
MGDISEKITKPRVSSTYLCIDHFQFTHLMSRCRAAIAGEFVRASGRLIILQSELVSGAYRIEWLLNSNQSAFIVPIS